MNESDPAVTRADGARLFPIASPRRIPFAAEYSLQDFERIKLGFRPRDMDDKWLILFESGVLSLYRSWTGHCIYRVAFEERDGKARARSAEVNRDPEQYNQSDDGYDARLLGYLIDTLLLDKRAEFPKPVGMNTNDADLYRHVVADAGATPGPKTRKPWWKFW